jgi:hypothetical protein
MICKIADLLVEVPATGGMSSRCKEYIIQGKGEPDIVIEESRYRLDVYPEKVSEDMIVYMESGAQFSARLVNYQGIYFHASAVEMDGKAYLFSGPCGMGKSTHTRLWQQTFGSAAQIFNDDKPVLRRLDGTWYAYGTPWCGKDGINQNKRVPVSGICFLKQAPENKIRRLSHQEALQKLLPQTLWKFRDVQYLDKVLVLADKLVREIPAYELENRPEIEAARLSYETMYCGAKEIAK